MSPRRITGPVEAMAHRVAERVVDRTWWTCSSPARPNWPASPLAGDACTAAER
jgi:hypothetical protein